MLRCYVLCCVCFFFFFKQKTAYEMRISDWSSDVCSSDLRLDTFGIESRILSGDRSDAVATVARELGLFAHAAASPQDKLAQLEQLKQRGHLPLMVGDGLNDGAALADAHASIEPGRASEASQQVADASFIGERLLTVGWAWEVGSD